MIVRKYQDLIAWQKAVALVTEIYGLTRDFPRDEIYGLTSQIRRAAVSVPSNIAEGQGRLTTGEFKSFLGHARGSLLELETQIVIAKNLRYMNEKDCGTLLSQTAEISRILHGLIKALEKRGKRRHGT